MSALQKYPEPTVGALIINASQKLFLVKSRKWKNDEYVIPGGHIELGESIEEAVVREVREETNLDVYDLEFLCFQEYIYGKTFYQKMHYIFFDYLCRTQSSEVLLNDEAFEYRWASLNEALSLPLQSYTRIVVDEYIRKYQLSLS